MAVAGEEAAMVRSDLRWSGAGVERSVPLPADAVFDTMIDVTAWPMWAHGVDGVIDVPERLEPGTSWRSTGRRRRSRRVESRNVVVVIDPTVRRLAHHTFAARGDAAYTEWRWECEAAASGCVVRVGWVERPELGAVAAVVAPARRRRMERRQRAALERLEQLATGRTVSVTRVLGVVGPDVDTDVVIAG